jgi:hypothetical protein
MKNAEKAISDKVGRGVPAEPEQMKPHEEPRRNCVFCGSFLGHHLLRLTGDGSPYLYFPRVFCTLTF